MELENDDSSNSDKFHERSFDSQLSRKHSISKHPSRALIVKNINPSIEDSELRDQFQVSTLSSFSIDISFCFSKCCPLGLIYVTSFHMDLQQYGDIQALHTSCKNHGFVTVSYYDIRAAQNAMRALHNTPLGLMNLDVQFSITKVNTLSVLSKWKCFITCMIIWFKIFFNW